MPDLRVKDKIVFANCPTGNSPGGVRDFLTRMANCFANNRAITVSTGNFSPTLNLPQEILKP